MSREFNLFSLVCRIWFGYCSFTSMLSCHNIYYLVTVAWAKNLIWVFVSLFDPCVEMGFSCFGFICFCLLYLQIVYTFGLLSALLYFSLKYEGRTCLTLCCEEVKSSALVSATFWSTKSAKLEFCWDISIGHIYNTNVFGYLINRYVGYSRDFFSGLFRYGLNTLLSLVWNFYLMFSVNIIAKICAANLILSHLYIRCSKKRGTMIFDFISICMK